MTQVMLSAIMYGMLMAIGGCLAKPLSRDGHYRGLKQATLPRVVYGKISAGVFTTCARAKGGKGYCWGYNDDGEVGDGTRTNRLTPTAVKLNSAKWKQFSGGDWHACGTLEDDRGYCWGYNGDGRLGYGSNVPSLVLAPRRLPFLWKVLSAGHFHSCGVLKNGTAVCWGNNKNGRLGDGRTSGIKTVVTRPRKILGGGSYEDICAKGSHSCGLRNDSTVYCWGGNTDGEIGNGKKSANVSTPSQVPGSWKQVACGLRFTCGISSKNQALCWGSLRGGGSAMVNTVLGPKPVVVGSGTWLQISGGMQHACGIKSDRKGYCFGLGFHGQLGNGKRTDCSYKKPCLVSGGHTWVEISAGEYNTCGVTTKGEAYCWGEDTNGKNGNGKAGGFYAAPTKVVGGISWTV